MITIVKLGPENKTGIGNYCFVNRTIKLWNQLATFSCKAHIFGKGVRKIIISEK